MFGFKLIYWFPFSEGLPKMLIYNYVHKTDIIYALYRLRMLFITLGLHNLEDETCHSLRIYLGLQIYFTNMYINRVSYI